MKPVFKPSADLLVRGGLVLTCAGQADDPVGRIPDGVIAVAGERILAVGAAAEVASQVDVSQARVLDAAGQVVAPGFVDSHTHLVFGGSRVAGIRGADRPAARPRCERWASRPASRPR